jgi:hypothetical protein
MWRSSTSCRRPRPARSCAGSCATAPTVADDYLDAPMGLPRVSFIFCHSSANLLHRYSRGSLATGIAFAKIPNMSRTCKPSYTEFPITWAINPPT